MDIALYLAGLLAAVLVNDLLAGRRHREMLAALKDVRMEIVSAGLKGRHCHGERTNVILEQLRKAFPELAERLPEAGDVGPADWRPLSSRGCPEAAPGPCGVAFRLESRGVMPAAMTDTVKVRGGPETAGHGL